MTVRPGPVPLAPAAGRLLVANPLLPDPNFDRTVVLILAAGDEGAVGLVLNRPSDTEVAAPLPDWGPLAAEPAVMFVGGPVQHQAVICLGGLPPGTAPGSAPDGPGEGGTAWRPVLPGVGTVDLEEGPGGPGPRYERIRLFAGYAGWGGGQLEAEIDAGAWWVVPGVPEDAFSDHPELLWRAVLRRQPPPLTYVAWFPDDPSAN